MTIEPRGSFNRDQVQQLLKPINPSRVVVKPNVKAHLTQQDVMAHLVRVLGFGHFDVEVLSSECIFEDATTNAKGKPAWSVGYRALVRLHVRDEQQRLVAFYDGGSTGESEGQPSRAASHDLAYKSALSTSMKRAAIALGDQFGLSLYNKGQMAALVKGTMIDVNHDGSDVQEGVEQQEVDGGRDGETVEEAPEKPARKVPTTGRQGTKRKQPEPEGEVAAVIEVGVPIADGPMAGIVPTEAQVAATQQVEQARADGVDTSVADEILDADMGQAAVLADETTGEVLPQTEDEWEAALRAAESVEALQEVWNRMVTAGARTTRLTAVTTARKGELS